MNKTYITRLSIIAVVCGLALGLGHLFFARTLDQALAAPPNPPRMMYGWLWSAGTQSFGGRGGVGWIKLNSCNIDTNTGEVTICDTGGQYGVQVAPDGTLSGYGWSPNFGWVDFAGTGCSAAGPAKVVGNTIKDAGGRGWIRFISVVQNPSLLKTGGWDGCVDIYNPTGAP